MRRSGSRQRASALVLTGAVLVTMLAARPSTAEDAPLWPDRQEIEHFLKKAKVTERKEIGAGVTHPEKVTLELDGTIRHAVFKKIDEPLDNWRNEAAAYELDKLFGLGMVPPTVDRSVGGRQCCLQLWVTGSTMDEYDKGFPDLAGWRDQVSVMWLFDDLIANVDRHLNNAMVSPEGRLILIDNSRAFRDSEELQNGLNAKVVGTNTRFWGVEYDALRRRFPTRYPRRLVERLRTVPDRDVKDAVDRYVWGWRQKVLLDRRRHILALVDAMGVEALRGEDR